MKPQLQPIAQCLHAGITRGNRLCLIQKLCAKHQVILGHYSRLQPQQNRIKRPFDQPLVEQFVKRCAIGHHRITLGTKAVSVGKGGTFVFKLR
ncbi:hypothetical protein MACH10_09210 [Thalassospira tepidiphila]|nr:hypothetical protein MACH10_09210 [Thalassospira tepidiphila]